MRTIDDSTAIVVDEECSCTLAAFFAANEELDASEADAVRSALASERGAYVAGGGAAAAWSVRRADAPRVLCCDDCGLLALSVAWIGDRNVARPACPACAAEASADESTD